MSEIDKARQLEVQGLRAMALGEWESAIETFGQAAVIVNEAFGPLDPRCGSIFFSYGRALLESSISQGGDLFETEVVERKQVADSDDDGNDDIEKGEGQEENESDQEDGNNDDLEFAWQWMELAKQIYEKQVDGGDESKREKLSECFLTLGDIQLENEQFDEACRDYALALKLKVELQKPDDRQIFEAHFKYGLALENCNRLSDAIGEMEKTMACIRLRIENLKKIVAPLAKDTKGKSKAVPLDDQSGREIEELEQLYIDTGNKLLELKGDDLPFTAPESPSQAVPVPKLDTVKDISSLVKKTISPIKAKVEAPVKLELSVKPDPDTRKRKTGGESPENSKKIKKEGKKRSE